MNKISYLFAQLPLGEALIASDGEGICYLSFVENQSEECIVQMKKLFRSKKTVYSQCSDNLIAEAVLQLTNWTIDSKINLSFYGSEFQEQVWKQLLEIPFGKVATYKEIAVALGKPKAVRAVANAIGQNHIAMLIPCHRVVRTDGSLAGFRWGIDRKKALLEKERAME